MGVQIPVGRGNFEGKIGIRDTAVICAKNSSTDRDAVWVAGLDEPMESCEMGVQIPPWEGAILGKRGSRCKV